MFTITPTEALAINIGIPINGDPAKDVYKQTAVQITLDIDGAGKAGLTFVGGKMEDEWVLNTSPNTGYASGYNDNPTLFAFFGLTAVKNFGLDIGIGYKFFDSYTNEVTSINEVTSVTEVKSITETVNNPLAVGLGVSFDTGDIFGIKARILGEFLGNSKIEGGDSEAMSYSEGYAMLFDILPYFKVNDNVTIFVSAGFGFCGGKESVDPEDPAKKISAPRQYAWNAEPYICVTPEYWSGAFFAGFRIESPITADSKGNRFVNWSIPIGITCSY